MLQIELGNLDYKELIIKFKFIIIKAKAMKNSI